MQINLKWRTMIIKAVGMLRRETIRASRVDTMRWEYGHDADKDEPLTSSISSNESSGSDSSLFRKLSTIAETVFLLLVTNRLAGSCPERKELKRDQKEPSRRRPAACIAELTTKKNIIFSNKSRGRAAAAADSSSTSLFIRIGRIPILNPSPRPKTRKNYGTRQRDTPGPSGVAQRHR